MLLLKSPKEYLLSNITTLTKWGSLARSWCQVILRKSRGNMILTTLEVSSKNSFGN